MTWYAKKVGPLPVGAYVVAGIGAVGIGLYRRSHGGGGTLPDQPTADESSLPFSTGPASSFFGGPPSPGPTTTVTTVGTPASDPRQLAAASFSDAVQKIWGSIDNYNAYARAHGQSTYADFQSFYEYLNSGRSNTFNTSYTDPLKIQALLAQTQSQASAWKQQQTKPSLVNSVAPKPATKLNVAPIGVRPVGR